MKTKLIATALLASAVMFINTAAAQTTTPPDREVDPALRELIAEFREQRRDVLELLKTLRERLANASEDERRAIIAEFRAEVRERNQAERELRKELRKRRLEMIRDRRQQRVGAGG